MTGSNRLNGLSIFATMRASRGRQRPSGRQKSAAVASMFAIGGLLVFGMAIMGAVIGYGGVLNAVYMDLTMTLPKFDYGISEETGWEKGNETFNAYVQMRYIGFGVMGAAIIYSGLARVFESESLPLVQRGTSNKIIANSLLFTIIFLTFPPLWDAGAEAMEYTALWVLNPLYSFDKVNPCPADWYDDPQKIVDLYNTSPYRKGVVISNVMDPNDPNRRFDSTQNGTVVSGESVCQPDFKVKYIFSQVVGTTTTGLTDIELTKIELQGEGGDFMENVAQQVEDQGHDAFTNTFLRLTKSLVTLNLMLSVFIIGVMVDVFIGMLIASLPVMMFLSLLPRMDKVVGQFIDAVPALFLLPLLSAVIFVVGAGFVADIGKDCVELVDCEALMHEEGSQANTVTYAWIASLAVVFLAITLPVMLVALLGRAVQMATQQVTSGMQTAAMVTGMAASGAAGGIMRGGGGMGSVMGGLSGLASGSLRGGMSANTAGFGGGGAGAVPGSSEVKGMVQGSQQEFAAGGAPGGFLSGVGNRIGDMFSHKEPSIGVGGGGQPGDTGGGGDSGDGGSTGGANQGGAMPSISSGETPNGGNRAPFDSGGDSQDDGGPKETGEPGQTGGDDQNAGTGPDGDQPTMDEMQQQQEEMQQQQQEMSRDVDTLKTQINDILSRLE